MDLTNNVTEKDLATITKSCDIIPKRAHVLVTLNQYVPDESEIELLGDLESMLDDWQYVISAGSGCEYVPGDKVLLDMGRLTQRVPDPEDRHRYIDKVDVKPVEVGEKTFTIMSDNYILAKKTVWEDIDLNS